MASLSRDYFARMSTSVPNFSLNTLEYLSRMSFNLCEGSINKDLSTESSLIKFQSSLILFSQFRPSRGVPGFK